MQNHAKNDLLSRPLNVAVLRCQQLPLEALNCLEFPCWIQKPCSPKDQNSKAPVFGLKTAPQMTGFAADWANFNMNIHFISFHHNSTFQDDAADARHLLGSFGKNGRTCAALRV